jgi:hypothetical protein
VPRRSQSLPWSPDLSYRRRLSEHLLYELQMTFMLASQLDGSAGTVPNVNARNAEVEAFAIHLRQLIEFFWIERPQTEARRNAFAADYFESGRWQQLRPARPAALGRDFHKSIGWGAAHLTYDRADVTGNDAWWRVRVHVVPLARAAKCFVENVDADELAPGVHESMTNCVSDFLATFPDLESSLAND